MASALETLSSEDLNLMIKEDHGAEITCNFCNERYHFDESELLQILRRRNA
jgi:molecular chaperone Hsp33